MASSFRDSLSRLTLGAYGLTVVALLAASFFPEVRLWGLNWYAYFGWSGRILLLLVAVVAPLALTKLKDTPASTDSEATENRRFLFWALIVTVLFVALYWFFRAQTYFLGDGYLLYIRLAEGSQPVRPWNPAVYWVQEWLNELLGANGEPSALLTFQLISYASGVVVMATASFAALRLFGRLRHRLLFLLGVASGGYALVFFGYVENYPLFVAAVAVFMFLGILALRGLVGRWWILLPLLVSLPLHPFSVAMFPAAVYVLVGDTPIGRWIGSRRWWVKTPVVLVSLAAAGVLFFRAYNSSYFFRFAIVPPVEGRFTLEGYTMFSADHILDYLNLLWQLQPGLLLLLVLALGCLRVCWREPVYRFLALLGAAALGIAILFDPKLGMPRDWDMFCFAGLPLTAMLYLAALDAKWRTTGSLRAAGLAITLGLLLLFPRALTQAEPEVSIELFDNYSNLDVFKNGGGRFLLLKYLEERGHRDDANRRRLENATTAQFEFWNVEVTRLMRQRQYRPAIARYRELLKLWPSYSNAWTNLGICHYQLRQYDSAIACLDISDGLNPFSVDVYHSLALSHYASGNQVKAEELWVEVTELVPTDPRPYRYLLLMYEYDGRADDYRRIVDRVLALAETPKTNAGLIKQAALLYAKQGDPNNAARQCRRLLAVEADTAFVISLQNSYPELKVVGDGR